MRISYFSNSLPELCQSTGRQRQALCCSGAYSEARWPEAAVHDQALPLAILSDQRRNVDLPDSPTSVLCPGDCNFNAQDHDSRVHWREVVGPGGKGGKDGCQHESYQLH